MGLNRNSSGHWEPRRDHLDPGCALVCFVFLILAMCHALPSMLCCLLWTKRQQGQLMRNPDLQNHKSKQGFPPRAEPPDMSIQLWKACSLTHCGFARVGVKFRGRVSTPAHEATYSVPSITGGRSPINPLQKIQTSFFSKMNISCWITYAFLHHSECVICFRA